MTQKTYLARPGQTLKDHLEKVASRCSAYCEQFGFKRTGFVLGMMHDLGKYRNCWQDYLVESIAGKNPPKEKHAVYGASVLLGMLGTVRGDKLFDVFSTFLANCIYSHHNTLHDCYSVVTTPDGNDTIRSLNEIITSLTYEDCLNDESSAIIRNCERFVPEIEGEFNKFRTTLSTYASGFQLCLMIKLLYSCLIDADRSDAGGIYDD